MASSRHAGHAGPCLSGRRAPARHQGERTSTSRQTCCPSRFPRCAGSSGVSSGPSRPTPSARSPGRTGDDDTSSAPDDHTGSAEPELINPGCSTKVSVFLLCSGSGDAYTTSVFLSQAEAEKAAARMVATLLAKSPDAVDLSQWRHELDAAVVHGSAGRLVLRAGWGRTAPLL